MKSRARDEVGVGKLQIADWKSLILRDILALIGEVAERVASPAAIILVRWLSGRKQRFAKAP